MKLIHCGDLHLNRAFSELGDPDRAAAAREEQWETFARIAALAASADVLLIAGDLFDDPAFHPPSCRRVRELLARAGSTPVVIAPGNHDPYGETSPYALFDFGENVFVFRGETEEIRFDRFSVYGNCGLPIGTVEPDPDRINLLCIHGQVGEGEYNPLRKEQMAVFDYCALGHVHSFVAQDNYAYCGVPLGGGFDETGQKGVIEAEVTRGKAKVRFVPLPGRQYRCVTVPLERADSYDGIEQEIRSAVGAPGEDCWRICLTGSLSPDFEFRTGVLYDRLKSDFYGLRLRSECVPFVSYEEMADEYTLRGLFVRELLDRIAAEPENEILRSALELGTAVLSDRPVPETEEEV